MSNRVFYLRLGVYRAGRDLLLLPIGEFLAVCAWLDAHPWRPVLARLMLR